MYRVWNENSKLTISETEALYQINKNFGYGGFIHHFKNFVIRRDDKYLHLAESSINRTFKYIDRYAALNLNQEERAAINAFREVVSEYHDKFKEVRRSYSKDLSTTELDSLVKVDDRQAFEALQAISNQTQTNTLRAIKSLETKMNSSTSILDYLSVISLIVLTVAGFVIIYIARYLTNVLGEFETLFHLSPDALIVSNYSGEIIRANQKAEEIFEIPVKQLCQSTIEDLMPNKFRGVHVKDRKRFTDETKTHQMEDRGPNFLALRSSGEEFPVSISISTYETPRGKYNISIVKDISKQKQIEKELNTDGLTGLSNRKYFSHYLELELHRIRRVDSTLSLIVCDIDFFKQVNDTHGHQKGDEVLIELAKVLKSNARASDLVCRWGGEEFIIVCPDTDIAGAQNLAEKTRNAIERDVISGVKITASFGISELQDQEGSQALFQRADQALFDAKASGRNCVASAV